MRVFIFSNDDLTSNIIFSGVLDLPGVEVAGVALAASPNRKSGGQLTGALALLRKVAFRYWLYLVVTNGLFKLYDMITRWFQLTPRFGPLVSLRRLCQAHSVPVSVVQDFSGDAMQQTLAGADIDLLLIRIPAILKKQILDIPKHATWCVHSSLLPGYKGIAGEFHALRHSDRVGTTIFKVTDTLDEGAPLFQIEVPSSRSASMFSHMLRNNLAAAKLLRQCVETLRDGSKESANLLNQGMAPSYFSWPQSKEVREFRDRGGTLISGREVASLFCSCLRARCLEMGSDLS
jgi:hypothetical protein